MRQSSLFETLGVALPVEEIGPVYDFFAGAGGFSEGARQAGCRVAWVCDNDSQALHTHAINHPDTEHAHMQLPLRKCDWPFPTDGSKFHVHLSPPCQLFSKANERKISELDREPGLKLVRWSLKLALTCDASTWSLEQVPAPEVVAAVEEAKKRYPKRVAYVCMDFVELGLPQHRKRLIAGSPHLIAKLQRAARSAPRQSTRSAIAKPRGTHIKGGAGTMSTRRCGADGRRQLDKAGWADRCRSIDCASFTVLANRGLNWITRTAEGSVEASRPRLVAHEYASLQSFPPTYTWPATETVAMRQIGNSVPPLVAKLLLGPEK